MKNRSPISIESFMSAIIGFFILGMCVGAIITLWKAEDIFDVPEPPLIIKPQNCEIRPDFWNGMDKYEIYCEKP